MLSAEYKETSNSQTLSSVLPKVSGEHYCPGDFEDICVNQNEMQINDKVRQRKVYRYEELEEEKEM